MYIYVCCAYECTCVCVSARKCDCDCACMLKYVSAHASVFMCSYECMCIYVCILVALVTMSDYEQHHQL